MPLINSFSTKDIKRPSVFAMWDVVIMVLIIGALFLISSAASDMLVQYELGDPIVIDLSPERLPYYALRTILRMFIALFLSLLCAFVVGGIAAKNTLAEKIILPAIDVMQSIPVIGFLEVSFLWIIAAFKGSFLGPELVSIFAVFVSQVWNLILCYYQSLKAVPRELDEVMRIYHLTPWQRFFRLEVPHAAPALIWNAMLSLSAGWFFVVAGEALTIANHDVALPGIGSYIAVATAQGDFQAVYYAIGCLFAVIMLYDQLLFRPLNYWLLSRENPGSGKANWVYRLVTGSRVWGGIKRLLSWLTQGRQGQKKFKYYRKKPQWLGAALGYGVLLWASYAVLQVLLDMGSVLTWGEVETALMLGAYTAFRVFVLVLLCCIVWVPVGIYLGMHEKASNIFQPVIQFLAAFPPNMLYPLVGSLVIAKGYNPNIWLSPLIVLGTQWYILFNVISGVKALPHDLLMMAKSLHLSQFQLCKKVILPGILPSLLTGVITAAGGAWNTSIIAEMAEWNGEVVYADGLGAFIMEASRNAQPDMVCLGVAVMCLYVLLINRVVWLPLYRMIDRRYGGR